LRNASASPNSASSAKPSATRRDRPELVLKGATLREDHDGWPPGTHGTILLAFDDGVLLEITDRGACGLVMLPVPLEALDVR
jgi:hypothetical protein